jgi:RNA polymerase sigma-70 factor (ECF subfamily)
MKEQELIPHLFRTESGKIIAVLTKMMGIQQLEAAEDIAADTFLAALETWPYHGLPVNPPGWLYTVAKNKCRNYLARETRSKEIFGQQVENAPGEETAFNFSGSHISDSMLQMLFAICHPSIPPETQTALALRILCGFGIDEIATAFLSNKETINKRLYRGREKLRAQNLTLELPSSADLEERLGTVLTTLYLLFSEGYYSETNESILRKELCLEAMRLTLMLIENPVTNNPSANALMALMCFHASRFDARISNNGDMVLYDDQDNSLWNNELVLKGSWYFLQSSAGDHLSKYHLEAGIAYWYTVKEDNKEKWEQILHLYNCLLQREYSPIAALNRTYALSKCRGKQAAIPEAEKLKLTGNRYWHLLLGELYRDSDLLKAVEYLKQALALSKSGSERQMIQKKLVELIGEL